MEQTQTRRKKAVHVRTGKAEQLFLFLLNAMGGFLFARGTFHGQALPFGVCLVSAQPTGVRALGAAIGAGAGYFFACDPAEAVEYSAVAVLMVLTLILFHGTGLPQRKWFMPLCCGLICGIMGGVRLIGSIEVTVPTWLVKAALGAVGTAVFRKTLGGHRPAQMLFGAILVFCLGTTGKYIDLGLLLAVTLSCAGRELLTGAVMGMALELRGTMADHMTLALILPGVFCKFFRVRRRETAAFAYWILPTGIVLLWGEGDLSQILAIVAGAVLGYLISRTLPITPGITAPEDPGPGAKLEQAAAVLDALRVELPEQTRGPGAEAEAIFDAAAEQICRKCPFFHRCWQNRAQETYGELSKAAENILRRGMAYPEDFSREFRDRCCSLERFIDVINRELEGMLYRRRFYARLRENRRILEQEYSLLSGFLRKAAHGANLRGERRFTPYVSICSATKDREKVCGDRGVCFMAPDNNYYVILCDGMGTGEEAAQLSSYAIRLLEKLLKSGLSAEEALKLLNGNMILRGSGTFSTVDLLRLDLYSGMAYIYKWGAAPSFWKDGTTIRKLGTPTPPPGVGVGEGEVPEKFKLSMKEGQLLVLISDGAYCEETESAVAAYCASSPGELAALLIAGMQAEDDMTAIVVSMGLRAS